MDESPNQIKPVHITRSAILVMIMDTYEAFRKECLGAIFGSKPTRSRDYYAITHAIPPQLLPKRAYKGIEIHERGRKKIDELIEKTKGLYPAQLGNYHSHTEHMGVKPIPEMSDDDIKSTKSFKFPLEVIIAVSLRNKKKAYLPWEILEDGGLRGSLLNLNFHINVFTLLYDK